MIILASCPVILYFSIIYQGNNNVLVYISYKLPLSEVATAIVYSGFMSNTDDLICSKFGFRRL